MIRDTHTRVVDCIAETTRYPKELLTGNADLESDLGIDSVKRVEIVAALAEEFRLELQEEERDPSIRTIDDIASWISRLANVDSAGLERDSFSSDEFSSDEGESLDTQPASDSFQAKPRSRAALPDRIARISERHSRTPPPPKFVKRGRDPHVGSVGQFGTESFGAAEDKTLNGRIALVTGSGRSVGRTIARLLAARGATVIINSFHSRDEGENTVAEIVSNGGAAFHVWGSVANPEHVNNLFAQIENRFGGLDILVCNASDGRIGSFAELTQEDWDRAFRTNVSGHHQCAIQAARLMQPRGGGSIVTMSAVGAHRFIDGLGSQGVVKAAVETMTKYLACELAPYGIRSNCVCGGPVYGDLLSKFPEADSAQHHWEAMTPGGSLSSPMDLARTIAFLVSDEARGINGAVWHVDQGFSAIADGRPLQRRPRRGVSLSSI